MNNKFNSEVLLLEINGKYMSDKIRKEVENYWQVVETIWDVISIYDGPEIFLKQFSTVSPEKGHLFAAHWCQSEVCNGGLDKWM